ncbi:MAG: hypothetical protein ACR5K2_03155 [Wolbachia sp.]
MKIIPYGQYDKRRQKGRECCYPSMRVVLNASKEGIDIAKLLSSNICKKYNVKITTFCYPNQEKREVHVAILMIMGKEFMK